MSVAFRRESDEEHKEPRFELPIPPGPNLVTSRGLQLIEDRIAALESDLATSGTEGREAIERDLRYWRTRRATAELAPVPTGDTVAFGSRVTYRIDGRERTIEIVGDDEADPPSGRVAFSAPLVRAMMGADAGETVMFGARGIDLLTTAPIAD